MVRVRSGSSEVTSISVCWLVLIASESVPPPMSKIATIELRETPRSPTVVLIEWRPQRGAGQTKPSVRMPLYFLALPPQQLP